MRNQSENHVLEYLGHEKTPSSNGMKPKQGGEDSGCLQQKVTVRTHMLLILQGG